MEITDSLPEDLHEVFSDGNSSSCSEEDSPNSSDEDYSGVGDPEKREVKLAITEVLARSNYEQAGREVEEEPDKITVAGNAKLMKSEVETLLDKIVTSLDLPYQPSQFQRVAVNTLCCQKNLVLVSPTGSGKMDVPLLSILVMREIMKNDKGVCIITQPLTSIINSKIDNKICKVASLSMAGSLKVSTRSEEYSEDASLSCNLTELLDGRYPVLMGHPESFDSNLGQHILRELQRQCTKVAFKTLCLFFILGLIMYHLQLKTSKIWSTNLHKGDGKSPSTE